MWIALGALSGLVAVAMAALAAHGLSGLDEANLAKVRSAVEMQGWHALALLACGLWAPNGGRLADWAGRAFAAGSVLFCGGVYATELGAMRLGFVVPAGGVVLMTGWGLLGASAVIAGRSAPR
jgi:uncharacterized membrane protein YgdD (TMEM256/DUF423 family)